MMITSLAPTVVIFPGAAPVPATTASIFPTIIVFQTNFANTGCVLPPNVESSTEINFGNEGSSAQINNVSLIVYQSQNGTADIIGNFSTDGVTWFPSLNNSDPPSHYVFVNKAFDFDCAFYPVINNYNGLFALAWLESNPQGGLDLRYTDISLGTPITNQPLPVNLPVPLSNTIYVYPYTSAVAEAEQRENIPLSDLTIVDVNGNKFQVDLSETHPNGLEISLDKPIKAFRWSQSFREPVRVIGNLTTLPLQSNNFLTEPLSNMAMNIYFGHTEILYLRLLTDAKGYYSFPAQAQEYTFEIESQNTSINVNQRLI